MLIRGRRSRGADNVGQPSLRPSSLRRLVPILPCKERQRRCRPGAMSLKPVPPIAACMRARDVNKTPTIDVPRSPCGNGRVRPREAVTA